MKINVTRKRVPAVLLAAVLGLVPGLAAADRPAVGDDEVDGWVARRVAAWQPTKEERRFDQIAWARDIREAERLAKQHGRPVFLFTHDGRMNIGRC